MEKYYTFLIAIVTGNRSGFLDSVTSVIREHSPETYNSMSVKLLAKIFEYLDMTAEGAGEARKLRGSLIAYKGESTVKKSDILMYDLIVFFCKYDLVNQMEARVLIAIADYFDPGPDRKLRLSKHIVTVLGTDEHGGTRAFKATVDYLANKIDAPTAVERIASAWAENAEWDKTQSSL